MRVPLDQADNADKLASVEPLAFAAGIAANIISTPTIPVIHFLGTDLRTIRRTHFSNDLFGWTLSGAQKHMKTASAWPTHLRPSIQSRMIG